MFGAYRGGVCVPKDREDPYLSSSSGNPADDRVMSNVRSYRSHNQDSEQYYTPDPGEETT